ncbi:MAG: porin [Pseudolabrys sp.]
MKPVQYVKICSLYGAGFYYIPGTDTCLKVGGWVRQYLGVGSNNNLTNGALGSLNVNTRASNNGWAWKSRGYITADARTQTEWGTLRGYIAVGESTQGSSGSSNFNSNRAFIQLAGFTFGVSQSFFDLFPQPAVSYFGGMIAPSNDTGDGGQTVTAYTAQFGGGLSATLSLEAPRTTTVFNATAAGATGAFITGTGATGALAQSAIAVRYPDVVGNLRMDAAWGTAQVMGAIHDASGTYYGATSATGDPGNATGWAIGAGLKLNVPMAGPGDYFTAQISYTQGALGYLDDGATTGTVANPGAGGYYSQYNGGTGGNFGFGLVTDSVYGVLGGANQSAQLTTAWLINAAYEHFWTKRWQTSVYGGYMATSYNSTANAMLCASEAIGAGCNNNWNYWDIGTRTQFNVDSQTYIGLDVIYTKLDQSQPGLYVSGQASAPVAVRTLGDQSAWIAEMRVHRNFYP